MTALQTDIDRAQTAANYFDRIYDDLEGWVIVGHGSEPYLAGPGKVKHRRFREVPFAWPRQRAELIEHVLTEAADHDVWTTPGLSENPCRSMDRRRPLPARHLWVDLDGATADDLAKLGQVLMAGTFTVSSGRGPGHLHVYIALDETTAPDEIAELNRRLVAALNGDASPSALNGYLRPPGSYNWKPTVLSPGSESVLVTIDTDTTGGGWAVSDLDDLLPAVEHHDAGHGQLPLAQPIDGDLPAVVAAILEDQADENLDRSERLFALVVACRRAGLTEGQILTIERQHRPSVAKYGRRVDEQIGRCLAKIPPDTIANMSGSGPDPEQTAHYENTDLGNARRLVDAHSGELRYVAEWAKWVAWDGARWKLDLTGEVQRRTKQTVEGILDEARAGSNDKLFTWGIRSQSHAGLNNCVNVAASEPTMPILVGSLDADPWALNVANGTVDLRNGHLRPHRSEDLFTKLTPVHWDPDATCPVFEASLEQIIPSAAVRHFVQRHVGYSLTGLTTEQVLVLFIGVGANGKSTLTNVLQELLGDYASPAPPRLLVTEKHSEHPTQVADLLGKRLVIAQEVQQGHALDEEMVKTLTGGDRLKARRMREDYWSFDPTHKLVLAANHRPRITGTDHAIWRRIRLVPFDVVIPATDQDHHLADKLRAELPGILNWAVQGCLAWQTDGLDAPDEVTVATDAYRQEQDVVAQFIGECCVTNPMVKVRSSQLYDAYKAWSERTGLRPLSQKSLAPRLEEHGYQREEDRVHRAWWLGIGLTEGFASEEETTL